MKKAFYICLMLCAVLLVYVGCKKKSKPVSVPMSIVRVVYSDTDLSDSVTLDDELFVVFDRHVTVAANPASSVFELSGAGDDFGTGALMQQTSGHALTIYLGTGAILQFYAADGTITSSIRVSATVPFGAIRDATWATSMVGGGSFTAISGCLYAAAPILQSAVYTDVDASTTPTQGDIIVVTFDGDINTILTATFWPGRVFILPVNWDGFGSGAIAQKTAVNEITITVGSGAKFRYTGTYAVGTYLVDSPSGIDVRIDIEAGVLTYAAGTTEVIVPPSAVDLE